MLTVRWLNQYGRKYMSYNRVLLFQEKSHAWGLINPHEPTYCLCMCVCVCDSLQISHQFTCAGLDRGIIKTNDQSLSLPILHVFLHLISLCSIIQRGSYREETRDI